MSLVAGIKLGPGEVLAPVASGMGEAHRGEELLIA